jgi:hypothetical protein
VPDKEQLDTAQTAGGRNESQMRPRGLYLLLVAIVTSLSATAGASSAVTQPIGIRAGSTVYRVTCREEVACNAEVVRICTTGNFIFARGGTPFGLEFICRPSKLMAADYVSTQPEIQVFIPPECKDMFYGPDFVDLDANGNAVATKKGPKPDYAPWDPGRAIPMSYKDPRTSITLYVESDGRHVVAIDSNGKLLWIRNPWEDPPAFCPYRTPRPVIESLIQTELTQIDRANLKPRGAKLEHTFIALQFTSSQYGVLDESTGDFIPEGQN